MALNSFTSLTYKFVITIVALFAISCAAQTPKNNQPEMKAPGEARIEVYTEIDAGRPDAGGDTFTFSDGTVYYGGKADYKPFIKKCTYKLGEAALSELLKENLRFQAYFKENKPDITLGDYFNSLAIDKTEAHRALFPKNLYAFSSYPEEERNSYNTLLSDGYYQGIIAVFLNDSTWYVDNAFYNSSIPLKLGNLEAECNEQYIEGNLKDFIKLSPIVQRKTNEGIADLMSNSKLPNYPLTGIVAAMGRHDGRGQGTWSFEIMADGKINYQHENRIQSSEPAPLVKSTYASPQKIAELLMLYKNNVAKSLESPDLSCPSLPNHDEDPMYIKIWNNGMLVTHYLYENDSRTPVWRSFVKEFSALFADEMGIKKE